MRCHASVPFAAIDDVSGDISLAIRLPAQVDRRLRAILRLQSPLRPTLLARPVEIRRAPPRCTGCESAPSSSSCLSVRRDASSRAAHDTHRSRRSECPCRAPLLPLLSLHQQILLKRLRRQEPADLLSGFGRRRQQPALQPHRGLFVVRRPVQHHAGFAAPGRLGPLRALALAPATTAAAFDMPGRLAVAILQFDKIA